MIPSEVMEINDAFIVQVSRAAQIQNGKTSSLRLHMIPLHRQINTVFKKHDVQHILRRDEHFQHESMHFGFGQIRKEEEKKSRRGLTLG